MIKLYDKSKNKISKSKLKRRAIFESSDITVDKRESKYDCSSATLARRVRIFFYTCMLHWLYELILYNKKRFKPGTNPAIGLMLILILPLTQEVLCI